MIFPLSNPPIQPTNPVVDAQVLAAIAETQTKGVRLPPACATELVLVPGGVDLVMGLLDPSPSARMTVPVSLSRTQPLMPGAKSSSSQLLLKLQFFDGFDWTALKNQHIRPVFVPPKSDLRLHSIRHVGDAEDEKFVSLMRRRPYEKFDVPDTHVDADRDRAAPQSRRQSGQYVAGYLESTTASRLAKTDKINDSVLKRRREDDEEEDEEARRRRLEDMRLFGDLLYQGEAATFHGF